MSGCLNRLTLIGNVCADPEIRYTKDNRPIANLRLATNETWRDRETGEKREKAEFHTVVCFVEGLCKVIEQYVKKGHKILCEGQCQTRAWEDKDGITRYTTECVLNGFNAQLILLEKQQSNRPPAPEGPEQYGRTTTRETSHQDSQQPMQRPQAGGYAPPEQGGYDGDPGFQPDDTVPY